MVDDEFLSSKFFELRMESSDDDKSKGSEPDSPRSGHDLSGRSHSFPFRDDDRPGRVLLRPWLENMLESNTIEGLQWLDREKTMFKVPWKHRSKKDWSTRHSSVFLEWAKNTGRWNRGDPTPNYAQLKTRLRCAFNKAPDIEEMKGYHSAQGEEPYKVYRFKNRKECLANKLNQSGKNLPKRFFGSSSGRGSNQGGLFEIKRERCEDEATAAGDGDSFYPDGTQEMQILSFKDQGGEMDDELKGDQRNSSCVSPDERETKFNPGVIPLTVEMFSSSVSDESDTENEGSKRSRGHRGRHGTPKGQKHQESLAEPQNGHLVPLKQQQVHQKQNDFGSNQQPGMADAGLGTVQTNGISGDSKESSAGDERGNLDFLTVASLFMEAEKILQNKKDPITVGGEIEMKQCIKQEIPEQMTSEGEPTNSSEESINDITANEPGKEKQSTGVLRSLDSTLNGVPKPSLPPVSSASGHGYPPKLPKLVPLSSLRNFPLLNNDQKGNASSTLLSQLSKIRMVNGNLLHQSVKPQVRLNPSPGTPSLTLGGQAVAIHRPDSATHFQPRLLILPSSSSSFLQGFSTPTMANPARPVNPESVRIVLGKFQAPQAVGPSIAKDSSFSSQSLPSLIMLSSAAEAAESATSVAKAQATLPGLQATLPINGTFPKEARNVAVPGNKSPVATNDVNELGNVMKVDSESCVVPAAKPVASAIPQKEVSMDTDAQEEALDLSSATLKQKEPEQSIPDDLSDKLEIDEVPAPICSSAKDDVSFKQITSDDGAMDINARMNEATTALRDAEELTTDVNPKCLKLLKGVIETLRTCSVELSQWQKSLNSEKDVLHWRTKLLESEEEKIQLKVQYYGITQKKDEPSNLGDPHPNESGTTGINKDISKSKQPFQVGNSILASNDKVLDLAKAQNPLIASKQSAPLGLLPQKVVGMTNVNAGPIKVTVAPSTPSQAPLQALTASSKSPKPIRVINLSKPSEPCGVVYPMQQDRSKAQQPRPSTPALSLVNGMKLACSLKSAGSQSEVASTSQSSPSSSPLVLNIQSPFNHLKVVKINRTPSTEGGLQLSGAWCPPTILSSSSAKSKSSDFDELKGADERLHRDSDLPDEGPGAVESSAKRFKQSPDDTINLSATSGNDNQTSKEYDQFKRKYKFM